MNVRLLATVSTLVLSITAATQCLAVLVGYTDRSAFEAAAVGGTTVVDFDTESTGTVASGSTIDGITFTYDFGTVSMTIDDAFDTTSPPNYLGTDDGGVFLDGDDIDFSFAPSTGFGLYIITADELFDDDLELTVDGETVGIVAADVEGSLPDDSDVYFLGIQSDDNSTFTTASLTGLGGGFFFYNLDDVVTAQMVAIPEAGSVLTWTVMSGICFGVVAVRRFRG